MKNSNFVSFHQSYGYEKIHEKRYQEKLVIDIFVIFIETNGDINKLGEAATDNA